LFSIIFILAGCSSAPPLTHLTLSFQSSDDLNPDVNNRPSPVDIRVFQLRNSDNFNETKFSDLYTNAQTVLDKDLIAEHKVEINLKQTQSLDLTLYEETQFLGFIVAYYDLEKSKWRQIRTLSSLKNPTLINLNAHDFSIQP
jgi:type VI secretion system protein VasD